MFMREHQKYSSTKDSAQSSVTSLSTTRASSGYYIQKEYYGFHYISLQWYVQKPYFHLCKKASSTSAISMSLRISLFLCLNPSQYCLNRALTQKVVIILYYLFFFCRLLTLNTIFKVIAFSGTSPEALFLIYFIYSKLWRRRIKGEVRINIY